MAKLIVGLGNPGEKYADTRHNLGFIILDTLSQAWGVEFNRTKFKGLYVEHFSESHEKIILLKPQTFMNLSGESVQPWMHYLKLESRDLLVVHDELDLAWGRLKGQQSAGAAGNRGIQSIIQHLGHQDFARLRVGIGRPPAGQQVNAYVLAKFSPDENAILSQVKEKSLQAIDCYLKKGIDSMLQMVNSKDFQIIS